MTFTTETETDFTRKNLPPLTDHAFMRALRLQCNTTKPMSRIAAELGVDVDALCAWIMAYTAKPKAKAKPYVNRQSPAIEYSHVDKDRYGASRTAQRFAAWRKQQEGARATRLMLEAADGV